MSLTKLAMDAHRLRQLAQQTSLLGKNDWNPKGNWKWALRQLRDGRGNLVSPEEQARIERDVLKRMTPQEQQIIDEMQNYADPGVEVGLLRGNAAPPMRELREKARQELFDRREKALAAHLAQGGTRDNFVFQEKIKPIIERLKQQSIDPSQELDRKPLQEALLEGYNRQHYDAQVSDLLRDKAYHEKELSELPSRSDLATQLLALRKKMNDARIAKREAEQSISTNGLQNFWDKMDDYHNLRRSKKEIPGMWDMNFHTGYLRKADRNLREIPERAYDQLPYDGLRNVDFGSRIIGDQGQIGVMSEPFTKRLESPNTALIHTHPNELEHLPQKVLDQMEKMKNMDFRSLMQERLADQREMFSPQQFERMVDQATARGMKQVNNSSKETSRLFDRKLGTSPSGQFSSLQEPGFYAGGDARLFQSKPHLSFPIYTPGSRVDAVHRAKNVSDQGNDLTKQYEQLNTRQHQMTNHFQNALQKLKEVYGRQGKEIPQTVMDTFHQVSDRNMGKNFENIINVQRKGEQLLKNKPIRSVYFESDKRPTM